MTSLNRFIRTLPKINSTLYRRTLSNKISDEEIILGEDFPSSRFEPKYNNSNKEITDSNIDNKIPKVDIDKSFTDYEKEFGLDFPSSRFSFTKCLLCYAIAENKCSFGQDTICYPSY